MSHLSSSMYSSELHDFIPSFGERLAARTATNLQRRARGALERSKYTRKKDAARRLQSLTRGRQSRLKHGWRRRDTPYPWQLEESVIRRSIHGEDIDQLQDDIEQHEINFTPARN